MAIHGAPKVVLQYLPISCWAASLESWLDSCDKIRYQSQMQLLSRHVDGFDIQPLRSFLSSFGMTTTMATANDAYATLEFGLGQSVVYLGHRVTTPSGIWWHCGVVYAIDNHKHTKFRVMDPAAYSKALTVWTVADLFPDATATKVLIGWQQKGAPGRVL